MKRKQPWLAWLSESNAEIAAAWMEAWWLDGRSHAPTARIPRHLRREIEQLRYVLIDLAANDPARALEVAFIVARHAEHPGMIAEIGMGVIQDVTAADPTLWDAVAVEAAQNRRLLHAIGLVWGANVPVPARDAFRRLVRPEEAPGAEALPSLLRGQDVEAPRPTAP
ncbi:hypothetical protein [Phenylobacterium sp.]|uniref:hypothetical protein n=1 Tax=Phenylobacterium sp. TaxID=1871053 RepID=UPI0025CFF84C|nr:hypothetical protein [Phenylobacterium sp.]MBX3485151.1 hypothetical protein [Phenylobacterium sp.]MCW5759865.1 hypothetical protein [Phenylobacterium sp.]